MDHHKLEFYYRGEWVGAVALSGGVNTLFRAMLDRWDEIKLYEPGKETPLIAETRGSDPQIAALRERAEKAEGNLASICDCVNTWAREENFRENHDYLGFMTIRDHIKELNGHVNGRTIRALEKIAAERDALRGEVEAHKKENERIRTKYKSSTLFERLSTLEAAAREVVFEWKKAYVHFNGLDPFTKAIDALRSALAAGDVGNDV